MASPNLCLEVLFTNVSPSNDPNIYTATFSGNNLNNLSNGMWVTNTSYGHAFKINSITLFSNTLIDVVLEDVDGYNTANDPPGNGGGPANDTIGYTFILTSVGINSLVTVTNAAGLDWGNYVIQRFANIIGSTDILIPTILTPPICLEVFFTNVLPTSVFA